MTNRLYRTRLLMLLALGWQLALTPVTEDPASAAVWQFAGNPGPGRLALVHRDADSGTLFVASGPPDVAPPFLWRSDDLGDSWIALSASPMDTLHSVIGAPAIPGGLYAVRQDRAGDCYLQVSDDGGGSWVTHTLPPDERFWCPVLPVVDPANPDGLYWPGLSLWYSGDRGTTWERRSTLRLIGLTARTNADDSLVAQVFYGFPGIVHSSDGGRNWSFPTLDVGEGTLFGFALAPSDPHRLYGSSDRGVLRSDDDGSTWQTLLAPEPTSCFTPVVERQDPDAVALLDPSSGRLRVSDDGGGSWSAVALPAEPIYGADFSELDLDDIWAVGKRLLHTTDGGATWAATASEVPSSGDRELRAAGGFVYALDRNSDPRGTIWRRRSTGSPESWIQRGSFPGPIETWEIDPARPATIYFGLGSEPGFWRSDDGGATSRRVARDFNRFPLAVVARRQPRGAATRLWIGTDEDAWRSDDGGESWTKITAGIPTGSDSDCHDFLPNCPFPSREIRQITQDAVSADVLYVERVDQFFVTENGGKDWKPILVPGGPGIRLIADPVHADTLYLLNDYPEALRRSTDRGKTWRRIRLPAAASGTSLVELRFEPVTGRPWLFSQFAFTCRTGLGVFVLEDRRWIRPGFGLPSGCVRDLVPVRAIGGGTRWFASVAGAGVWELEP